MNDMEEQAFPYDDEGDWLETLDADTYKQYRSHRWNVHDSLRDACDLFGVAAVAGWMFPVDQWLHIEVPYIINDHLPDAAERFRILAERVERAGGRVIRRETYDKTERRDTVQHIAELPIGQRVRYRVTWIERLPQTIDVPLSDDGAPAKETHGEETKQ